MASPTISGVEAGQFGFDIIVVFFDGTHNSRCSAGNLSLKTFTDAPSPTLVRTSYLQPRPSTSKVQGLSQPRIRAGGSGFSKPQKLAELALSSRRTDDRALLVKDIAFASPFLWLSEATRRLSEETVGDGELVS